MHHDYLALCQINQSVSRFHFDVGYAILTAADVTEPEVEQVLTALLLLEQALSIHNRVDSCSEDTRGLVVLAGDYDSSKYFFLLAQLEVHELLHTLCEAVARINEAKMTIALGSKRLSVQNYRALMNVVRGELLRALASHYLGADDFWTSHVESLVEAHVMQLEMDDTHLHLAEGNQ